MILGQRNERIVTASHAALYRSGRRDRECGKPRDAVSLASHRGAALQPTGMAAAKKSPLVELFWRLHRSVYRLSGGRLGNKLMGLPVLLLTTKGRKSGERRTSPLMYLPRGKDFVVIASYLGEPRHPAWFLNLEANPVADVQLGSAHHRVRAREAEGSEREELWRTVVAKTPDYAEYQTRTTRRIPVVVLEPA